MRLLVIEDSAPIRDAVAQGLREAGYAVDTAADGEEGLYFANSDGYDVILLDLMLPRIDGWEILRRLRARKCPSHVLALTAKDTAEDRVRGLDLGADDYLVKPFVFSELLARVRALVRRKYEIRAALVRVADLEIDTSTRVARRAGQTLDLSGREYALLEYLAHSAGRIVSRTDIWEHVYDFNASLESNVVDVFIARLRRKVEREGLRRLIHTRRGQGYLLGEVD